jgi:phage shock protein A
MKRLGGISVCLLFLLVAGCGTGAAGRIADLERKNEQLSQRVKNLEDQLLAAEKKMIGLEQGIQQTNSRMKDLEGYFMRMQYSQSSR